MVIWMDELVKIHLIRPSPLTPLTPGEGNEINDLFVRGCLCPVAEGVDASLLARLSISLSRCRRVARVSKDILIRVAWRSQDHLRPCRSR